MTVERHKVRPKEKQSQAFIDAARALECDESEERFDAALRKIAAHKPRKDSETDSPEARAKARKE
jgi:hypothetical protein